MEVCAIIEAWELRTLRDLGYNLCARFGGQLYWAVRPVFNTDRLVASAGQFGEMAGSGDLDSLPDDRELCITVTV
jgi:hypothetical protein